MNLFLNYPDYSVYNIPFSSRNKLQKDHIVYNVQKIYGSFISMPVKNLTEDQKEKYNVRYYSTYINVDQIFNALGKEDKLLSSLPDDSKLYMSKLSSYPKMYANIYYKRTTSKRKADAIIVPSYIYTYTYGFMKTLVYVDDASKTLIYVDIYDESILKDPNLLNYSLLELLSILWKDPLDVLKKCNPTLIKYNKPSKDTEYLFITNPNKELVSLLTELYTDTKYFYATDLTLEKTIKNKSSDTEITSSIIESLQDLLASSDTDSIYQGLKVLASLNWYEVKNVSFYLIRHIFTINSTIPFNKLPVELKYMVSILREECSYCYNQNLSNKELRLLKPLFINDINKTINGYIGSTIIKYPNVLYDIDFKINLSLK